MGFEARSLIVSGAVSKHNAPQDRIDYHLWELFAAEVAKLVDDPMFRSIRLEITNG